jgi:hypothetical protein
MAVINKLCLGQVTIAGSASDTYTLTASPLTGNLQQADVRILCSTENALCDVTLPEISTFNGLWQGLRIMVVDADGDAGTNNIIIRSAGTDEIEGAPTETINTDAKCLIFRVATDEKWERSA